MKRDRVLTLSLSARTLPQVLAKTKPIEISYSGAGV